jgi:hypothetical protein
MTPTYDDLDMDSAIEFLVNRHGFPTFDEFRKNPDKWRMREDELFASADASTQTFKQALQTQKYQWKDEYLCDSLEQVERIAKDEGFKISDLEMQPAVRTVNGTSPGGPVEIIVRFWPKEELKVMGGIVAND